MVKFFWALEIILSPFNSKAEVSWLDWRKLMSHTIPQNHFGFMRHRAAFIGMSGAPSPTHHRRLYSAVFTRVVVLRPVNTLMCEHKFGADVLLSLHLNVLPSVTARVKHTIYCCCFHPDQKSPRCTRLHSFSCWFTAAALLKQMLVF